MLYGLQADDGTFFKRLWYDGFSYELVFQSKDQAAESLKIQEKFIEPGIFKVAPYPTGRKHIKRKRQFIEYTKYEKTLHQIEKALFEIFESEERPFVEVVLMLGDRHVKGHFLQASRKAGAAYTTFMIKTDEGARLSFTAVDIKFDTEYMIYDQAARIGGRD